MYSEIELLAYAEGYGILGAENQKKRPPEWFGLNVKNWIFL